MRRLFFITVICAFLLSTGCAATKSSKNDNLSQKHYSGMVSGKKGSIIFRDDATYLRFLLDSSAEITKNVLDSLVEINAEDDSQFITIEFFGEIEPSGGTKSENFTNGIAMVDILESASIIKNKFPTPATLAGLYDTPSKNDRRYVLHLKTDYTFQITEYALDSKKEVITKGKWYRTASKQIVLQTDKSKNRIAIYRVEEQDDTIILHPECVKDKYKKLLFKKVYV